MATLFEGIEKRVISGESRTPGLTKGTYVVAIDDVIFKKTRAAGDAFIVEFTVKESSDPANHPVGSKRGWYQPYNKIDIAEAEVLKFMYAALGYDPKRDKDRIPTEVTPHIKAWTNAAVNTDVTQGPVKMLNGKCSVRVEVWDKPPNAAALLKNPNAKPWATPSFSPASPNPPPART